MECKTYAAHARNRWAVGTPAKKHIPEQGRNTNTAARSVEWPLLIPHHTLILHTLIPHTHTHKDTTHCAGE